MKSYFADTNFYLRFLLQDIKPQAEITKTYFKQAKEGKIEIIFIDAVIFEMVFVLGKIYKLTKPEISEKLLDLIKTSYVNISDRLIWIKAFTTFSERKIALLDVFLFEKAQECKAEVLTFDKKLRNLAKNENTPPKG